MWFGPIGIVIGNCRKQNKIDPLLKIVAFLWWDKEKLGKDVLYLGVTAGVK